MSEKGIPADVIAAAIDDAAGLRETSHDVSGVQAVIWAENLNKGDLEKIKQAVREGASLADDRLETAREHIVGQVAVTLEREEMFESGQLRPNVPKPGKASTPERGTV